MRCKKVFDARKLPRKAKEQLRIAAAKRVENGESPEDVASGLGINRRQVYRWISLFAIGGEEALKAKKIPGAPPKLKPQQAAKLAKTIRGRNPLQLKFEYALWTLSIIRELIRRQYGVNMSAVSVGRLMKRLGFTPQRPLYRAWQQDPALVERWQQEEYPQIATRAKKENAMIFFADEAGIRSDYHAGTSWAPIGETPVVKVTGARFAVNMISAVNAMGSFRFMLVDGQVTAKVFRDFLKRLITGVDRKIFLIVDGHPTHKAKLIKQFVSDNAERIELFYLPPYSPDLNPDELTWAHIKPKIAKATIKTKEELKKAAFRAMRRLQKTPTIVAKFFHCLSCRYAMA